MLKLEDIKAGNILCLQSVNTYKLIVLKDLKFQDVHGNFLTNIMWLDDQKYVRDYVFFNTEKSLWTKLC